MQLYFIRHAQSENNAHWGDDNYEESHDPELTQKGYAQVKFLSRYLDDNPKANNLSKWNPQNRSGIGLTHIYTSLMVRAVGTAQPAAQATGLPLAAWPEIHETGGIFSRRPDEEMCGLPGKPRSFFESHFPDVILPDELDETGWWHNRPFEDYELRQIRAEKIWNDLVLRHGDRPGRSEHRVALVSHGGFFMHFLSSALQIKMRRIKEFDHEFWFLINNCSITRIDFLDNRVLVVYVNRTDFLPDELIT